MLLCPTNRISTEYKSDETKRKGLVAVADIPVVQPGLEGGTEVAGGVVDVAVLADIQEHIGELGHEGLEIFTPR